MHDIQTNKLKVFSPCCKIFSGKLFPQPKSYVITSFFLLLIARNSNCRVQDWVGFLVSIGLILCGIACITVISLYKEKVKDEVNFGPHYSSYNNIYTYLFHEPALSDFWTC